MSDPTEADVDVNLLSELLELAEKDDTKVEETLVPSKGSMVPQTFDSVLEELDNIPIKMSTRKKLLGKTSQFKNDKNLMSQSVNEANMSVVHTGNTDSSDDEDVRKHGSHVDSFGANVRRMLKSEEEDKQTAPRLLDFKRQTSKEVSWKSPASKSASLCLPEKKKIETIDAYMNPSIGLRIINPLVSSAIIQERLVGRKVVSMSQVKQFTFDGKITDDWVIFGAIVSKAPPRTSSKGTPYGIIKLSDLRGPGNPKMVSLFLFSSAFKKHGKDSLGTVLGILNPGVMDNSRSHGDEACLSVDNADRIMVLGTSKDFGLCKSKKKNGENCTSVVNIAQCEYCVYHVKQEYQKCSKRSELQSSFNGPGLNNLRNKVLGKNEVFYGGQSFSALPAKKNKKMIERDQSRLTSLSGSKNIVSLMRAKQPVKSGIATSVESNCFQRLKDKDRLLKLKLDDEKCLANPTALTLTATSSANDVTPDEAKLAALSLIAKKKGNEVESIGVKNVTVNENMFNDVSSAIKDAARVSENVPQSRGVKATLSLTQKKKNTWDITPSSLGLGRGVQAEKETGPVEEREQMSTNVSRQQTGESSSFKMTSQALSQSKQALSKKMCTNPTMSSKQLLRLSSNGLDFESRLLKQAAQKAALQEEAAKLNPNATPSMLGLGRGTLVDVKNNSRSMVPQLGKGLTSSATIDLSIPLNKRVSNPAKLDAIKIIKGQGGISKKDPNYREFESRKKNMKESQSVKRPREESPNAIASILKKLRPSASEEMREAEEQKAKFKELMEKTSRHVNLIVAAENEAQDEYFGKLEKKEQMEEKMLNTFKIACKAVRCLTCKYTSFSASEMCKTERHPLKVMDAVKRFFKCGDCGNRTVSLDVIPLVSCTNCRSSRWERTAMIRERKVGVSKETLSVRGMEETFIGSVTTGANINLLVPDDGT